MIIGLLVNQKKKRALTVAEEITRILTDGGAEVLSSLECPIPGTAVAGTAEQVIEACDIAVTVGGDGTIIHNAKFAALYNKPLLGVNLGRIGFVANIEPDELEELAGKGGDSDNNDGKSNSCKILCISCVE